MSLHLLPLPKELHGLSVIWRVHVNLKLALIFVRDDIFGGKCFAVLARPTKLQSLSFGSLLSANFSLTQKICRSTVFTTTTIIIINNNTKTFYCENEFKIVIGPTFEVIDRRLKVKNDLSRQNFVFFVPLCRRRRRCWSRWTRPRRRKRTLPRLQQRPLRSVSRKGWTKWILLVIVDAAKGFKVGFLKWKAANEEIKYPWVQYIVCHCLKLALLQYISWPTYRSNFSIAITTQRVNKKTYRDNLSAAISNHHG